MIRAKGGVCVCRAVVVDLSYGMHMRTAHLAVAAQRILTNLIFYQTNTFPQLKKKKNVFLRTFAYDCRLEPGATNK